MELMGGSLFVDSTPGVGSTFTGEVLIAPERLEANERGADS
jgi:signal transduction histidine kinase